MTLLHMLDTDAASYIIKGRPEVVRARIGDVAPDRLCVSVITRAELAYGLKRLPSGHRLHLGVRRFLGLVRILSWSERAADHYADIRHDLATSGRIIGELDMMIAAHAMAEDAILITNNLRHFGRMSPPLALRDWGGA